MANQRATKQNCFTRPGSRYFSRLFSSATASPKISSSFAFTPAIADLIAKGRRESTEFGFGAFCDVPRLRKLRFESGLRFGRTEGLRRLRQLILRQRGFGLEEPR